MRIISRDRNHFWGTHKGCDIQIERDREMPGRTFYIMVQAPSGGLLYDGWAPEHITTMVEAKREALYGACLKPRPAAGAPA